MKTEHACAALDPLPCSLEASSLQKSTLASLLCLLETMTTRLGVDFFSRSRRRSLTDCREARSSFFTTTLPLPLCCRISSAAMQALVTSLQARITLAPLAAQQCD
ncbi:hypothetical protein EYF80_039575 [Liparis tanakae]|uniref:Uncharacterized protein n=1 Tax=Liparis tanakae TaxID=230148 RepID=A0A4Z2G9N7_9TELE|nr:hypothetical protein EYF80_039575 [Liparis tanakae]